MKKPKKKAKKVYEHHHSLKALRSILEMGGKEFAAKLGMPYRTLVAIEVGQRELQPETARKLMILFGVLPQTVLSKYFDPPLDLNGDKYTKEFFQAYKAQVTAKPGPLELEMAEKAHDHKLRVLLEVAKRKGVLIPMLFDFQEWLDATLTAYVDGYGSDFKRTFDDLNWKDDGAKNVIDRYPLFELRHGRNLMRYGRTKVKSGTNTKEPSAAFKKVAAAIAKQLEAQSQTTRAPRRASQGSGNSGTA